MFGRVVVAWASSGGHRETERSQQPQHDFYTGIHGLFSASSTVYCACGPSPRQRSREVASTHVHKWCSPDLLLGADWPEGRPGRTMARDECNVDLASQRQSTPSPTSPSIGRTLSEAAKPNPAGAAHSPEAHRRSQGIVARHDVPTVAPPVHPPTGAPPPPVLDTRSNPFRKFGQHGGPDARRPHRPRLALQPAEGDSRHLTRHVPSPLLVCPHTCGFFHIVADLPASNHTQFLLAWNPFGGGWRQQPSPSRLTRPASQPGLVPLSPSPRRAAAVSPSPPRPPIFFCSVCLQRQRAAGGDTPGPPPRPPLSMGGSKAISHPSSPDHLRTPLAADRPPCNPISTNQPAWRRAATPSPSPPQSTCTYAGSAPRGARLEKRAPPRRLRRSLFCCEAAAWAGGCGGPRSLPASSAHPARTYCDHGAASGRRGHPPPRLAPSLPLSSESDTPGVPRTVDQTLCRKRDFATQIVSANRFSETVRGDAQDASSRPARRSPGRPGVAPLPAPPRPPPSLAQPFPASPSLAQPRPALLLAPSALSATNGACRRNWACACPRRYALDRPLATGRHRTQPWCIP